MERMGTALGVEVAELLSPPAKSKPRDDRLVSVLRGVCAATRRRVIRVAEALVREDRVGCRAWPASPLIVARALVRTSARPVPGDHAFSQQADRR